MQLRIKMRQEQVAPKLKGILHDKLMRSNCFTHFNNQHCLIRWNNFASISYLRSLWTHKRLRQTVSPWQSHIRVDFSNRTETLTNSWQKSNDLKGKSVWKLSVFCELTTLGLVKRMPHCLNQWWSKRKCSAQPDSVRRIKEPKLLQAS